MRTTVDIPDELYQRAESRACQEGVPVSHVITQALRTALRETPPAGRHRIIFPLIHSAQPGTLGVEQVRAAEDAAAQEEDAGRAGTL